MELKLRNFEETFRTTKLPKEAQKQGAIKNRLLARFPVKKNFNSKSIDLGEAFDEN